MSPEQNWPKDSISSLLSEARAGSGQAVGELFERYRAYLLLIANAELAEDVRPKLGPSDAVQQSWLLVQQGFPQFQGETADAWKGWLRAILRNTLANCVRDFKAAKRDVGREVPLRGDDSSAYPANGVAAPGSSPSEVVRRQESEQLLRKAVRGLPEHYREVVRQHSLEGMTFEEIAQRWGKSEATVRKLWGRAVELLADLLENPRESAPPRA